MKTYPYSNPCDANCQRAHVNRHSLKAEVAPDGGLRVYKNCPGDRHDGKPFSTVNLYQVHQKFIRLYVTFGNGLQAYVTAKDLARGEYETLGDTWCLPVSMFKVEGV